LSEDTTAEVTAAEGEKVNGGTSSDAKQASTEAAAGTTEAAKQVASDKNETSANDSKTDEAQASAEKVNAEQSVSALDPDDVASEEIPETSSVEREDDLPAQDDSGAIELPVIPID